MKRLPVYIILFTISSLLTGCQLISSKNKIVTYNRPFKNLPVSGIHANGDYIIAGTSSMGSTSYIFLSVDNGTNWQQVDSIHVDNTNPSNFHGTYTHTSFFGNSKTIFAGIGGGYKGKVLISIDNGKIWTEPDPSFSENTNCFAMINGTLYAGTNHGVFMTKNNGHNWSAADTAGLSYPVVGLVPLPGYLFAATSGEGIYRSSDNGASWKEVFSTNYDFRGLAALGGDIFAPAFQFPGDTTGGIFVTTDNGASWKEANDGLTDHTVNALYANGSDLFTGTNNGAYFSLDKGKSWALVDSVSATSFAANNTYLFVGTATGIKRYLLSKLNK